MLYAGKEGGPRIGRPAGGAVEASEPTPIGKAFRRMIGEFRQANPKIQGVPLEVQRRLFVIAAIETDDEDILRSNGISPLEIKREKAGKLIPDRDS